MSEFSYNFSVSFDLDVRLFRIRRISVTKSVALASEIGMVLVSPLTRKPRMSFL
jgi:hypothetical protein